MTTLTFTPEQLSVIDQALQQMPYGIVAPLIANINAQIQKAASQDDTIATERAPA